MVLQLTILAFFLIGIKRNKTMTDNNETNPQLQELITPILEKAGGELTSENMSKLNSDEITLLAYSILRRELLEGGFVQLIQNGYGPFIFLNPFAKALRLWGAKDFSKWIYDARSIFEETRGVLERPTQSDEEFMGLYEQYPEWDEFDDYFIEMEPETTSFICNLYRNLTKNNG